MIGDWLFQPEVSWTVASMLGGDCCYHHLLSIDPHFAHFIPESCHPTRISHRTDSAPSEAPDGLSGLATDIPNSPHSAYVALLLKKKHSTLLAQRHLEAEQR